MDPRRRPCVAASQLLLPPLSRMPSSTQARERGWNPWNRHRAVGRCAACPRSEYRFLGCCGPRAPSRSGVENVCACAALHYPGSPPVHVSHDRGAVSTRCGRTLVLEGDPWRVLIVELRACWRASDAAPSWPAHPDAEIFGAAASRAERWSPSSRTAPPRLPVLTIWAAAVTLRSPSAWREPTADRLLRHRRRRTASRPSR